MGRGWHVTAHNLHPPVSVRATWGGGHNPSKLCHCPRLHEHRACASVGAPPIRKSGGHHRYTAQGTCFGSRLPHVESPSKESETSKPSPGVPTAGHARSCGGRSLGPAVGEGGAHSAWRVHSRGQGMRQEQPKPTWGRLCLALKQRGRAGGYLWNWGHFPPPEWQVWVKRQARNGGPPPLSLPCHPCSLPLLCLSMAPTFSERSRRTWWQQ